MVDKILSPRERIADPGGQMKTIGFSIHGQKLNGVEERLWKILRQASPGGGITGMPSPPATATQKYAGSEVSESISIFPTRKIAAPMQNGGISGRDRNPRPPLPQ